MTVCVRMNAYAHRVGANLVRPPFFQNNDLAVCTTEDARPILFCGALLLFGANVTVIARTLYYALEQRLTRLIASNL